MHFLENKMKIISDYTFSHDRYKNLITNLWVLRKRECLPAQFSLKFMLLVRSIALENWFAFMPACTSVIVPLTSLNVLWTITCENIFLSLNFPARAFHGSFVMKLELIARKCIFFFGAYIFKNRYSSAGKYWQIALVPSIFNKTHDHIKCSLNVLVFWRRWSSYKYCRNHLSRLP